MHELGAIERAVKDWREQKSKYENKTKDWS
jgi:hypothetical protein